jgi:hypothetical protein
MGEADMVIGERGRSSFQHRRRRPGKWLLGMLARFLTGRRIPDLNSGLRAMRRDMITRYLHLLPDGFSASTTMTIAALKRGRPVVWVPITAGSPLGDSQVHVLRDGFGTVLLILRLITLFDPLRIFLPAAALFLITGFISGVYYFFYGSYGGGVSVGSLLLLVTGMLLFFSGLLADQIAALRLERYE